MAYQVKPDPPVESLPLTSMQVMFDTHKMLWDFGYRGSFSTTASVDGEGVTTESGHFDMVFDGNVPVDAALGDVILYRLTPTPHVVGVVSADEFAAKYETV